jgi:hypothetical protein
MVWGVGAYWLKLDEGKRATLLDIWCQLTEGSNLGTDDCARVLAVPDGPDADRLAQVYLDYMGIFSVEDVAAWPFERRHQLLREAIDRCLPVVPELQTAGDSELKKLLGDVDGLSFMAKYLRM